MFSKIKYRIDTLRRIRLILDTHKRLGNFSLDTPTYDVTLSKEEVSRRYLFSQPGENLNFLDVGARDGELTYLLGIDQNLQFDEKFYKQNLSAFKKKYSYYGMDLIPTDDTRVLSGDICSPGYLEDNSRFHEFFDFIYSNNVFEHLRKPWIASKNLLDMLKPGGICATIVPFAQRYHESPQDYFRYTHTGLISLFEDHSADFTVLESGYDLIGRRNNWQGSGEVNDIVPLDAFGAWRETWFTVCVFRKNQ